MEFTNYNYGHDEWHNSSAVLKKHLWSRNGPVHRRMPLAWGPMPSPRQDHLGRPFPSQNSRFTATTVRFRTSATLLKSLFPSPCFRFLSPGTVAEASLKCTQLEGMQWLGGGGYNMVGLYIHNVQYEKRDGSAIAGTYLPILLEDLADPIVSGREEIGMPKLYCDITVTGDDDSKRISCSWRGTKFIDMRVSGIVPAHVANDHQITTNGSKDGPHEDSSKELTSEKLLLYRYVPAVGQPGVADAEYAVVVDSAEATTPIVVEETQKGVDSWIRFIEGDSATLPTLHHVASGLAEIPVYEVLGATVERGRGVDCLDHARRVE